ncbi:unnamed protein product [Tilletia controversa]|uniref:Thiolase n=3 Tax=Tilletia TaxID=13289 RepID=A0A8X7MVN4_9BASI|nr:hypothetical protein CF336_g2584 [Tilletia laevis]KAE8204584.1 hypothetical protein CF328_g989 [Tilletia controversa]KAE8262942.1 hypothetical protein A4X03_0g2053 [Tilletia caries]KAE8205316.1 hypothetical protein CF335_g2342 [Tilletia laevis]KAE8251002.1 hypothetical protein A4X06_0g2849 [Tilletia controversa]
MASRISQIASHLDPRSWLGHGLPAARAKNDDDVVIVALGRTPFTKAWKGGLKDTPFDVLLLETIKAILAKADVDPALIEEVIMGNVRNNDSVYDLRAACLAAGIPNTTPSQQVNRWCSSGLMAVRSVANQIQAGEISCGLAIGAESMTFHPKREWNFSPEVTGASQEAADCVQPMGWTSENVAGDFSISREKMDAFAARSHQRAAAAQASGKFDAEILPILSRDGTGAHRVLSQDDGIRPTSNVNALAKIKAAFPQWPPSHTTGGNASQITDGAAAILLMRRSLANKLGKKIIAKYVATAVSGLAPRIMGIGPTFAIPRVLELTGIRSDEVDLFEINEAFASMGVYSQEKLAIPDEKFNVNGGAIALGHPLGATGARLIVTALAEAERRNQHVVVVSMCIGLGMGAAGIFIRE